MFVIVYQCIVRNNDDHSPPSCGLFTVDDAIISKTPGLLHSCPATVPQCIALRVSCRHSRPCCNLYPGLQGQAGGSLSVRYTLALQHEEEHSMHTDAWTERVSTAGQRALRVDPDGRWVVLSQQGLQRGQSAGKKVSAVSL